MSMAFHVYLISSVATDKKYVGVTSQHFEKRFTAHKWYARKNGRCSALYAAMRKYGDQAFSVELIEECSSFEEMNEREIYWIAKLGTLSPDGYNLTTGGDAGKPCEMVAKMASERLKGKPMPESNYKALQKVWADPAWQERRRLAVKAAMNRPEVREATGVRQRGVPKSAKHIESLREKRSKAVLCVDTGQMFEAIVDAVNWIRQQGRHPMANHSKIIRATKRSDYTAYGYHWKYVK